jgi:hypothetical protein
MQHTQATARGISVCKHYRSGPWGTLTLFSTYSQGRVSVHDTETIIHAFDSCLEDIDGALDNVVDNAHGWNYRNLISQALTTTQQCLQGAETALMNVYAVSVLSFDLLNSILKSFLCRRLLLTGESCARS